MPTVAPRNFASPSSQTAPIAVDGAATWNRACLNCASALAGPFCSECGQRAVPPHPSLRELAGDAFAELSGWDGKLAESIRALLFRPGRLTIEFIEGRRARYIAPLRLYLVASVVYFALTAGAPERSPVKITTSATAAQTATPPVTGKVDPDPDPDVDPVAALAAARERVNAGIAKVPPIFRPVVRRIVADQAGFRSDMFNAMPKALFVLLPVFAGILKLFYLKRRYAEHLYYALHVHAFGFAALTVSALVRYTHSLPIEQGVSLLILVGVPFYWHRALRRVYGGSLGATLLKETGVGILYSVASLPVLIGLAMWVVATKP
jgi:hypothetical protein